MTTQHTPGPWHKMKGGMSVKGEIPNLIQIYATNEDLEMICQVWKDGHLIHRTQDHEANARLIAAAPELLEALTALLKAPTPESIRQAEAVILKATGDKVGSIGVDNTPPPQEEWITEIYDQDGHYIGMIKHSISEEELKEKIYKHFEEVNDNLEDFCQNTPGCERIYVDGSIYLH